MATSIIKKVTPVYGSNTYGSYYKMPDGIMIQWGIFECNDTKTTEYYNLELPCATTNSDLRITFGNYGGDTGSEFISTYSVNPDNKILTVKVVKPSGWAAFHWIAIGRWK